MPYTASFVEALAARRSHAVLHSLSGVVTSDDLMARSSTIARMLEQRGFGDGDVAVVLMPPDATFLAIVYAAMISGMTLALIDPEMGLENYRAKLAQLKPAIAFVDSRVLLLHEHPLLYAVLRRLGKAPSIPKFRDVLVVSVGPWMPTVRRHVSLTRLLRQARNDAASSGQTRRRCGDFLITYTSGTLAEPKGVVHTLDGLAESVRLLGRILGEPAGQRIATHLPHYMLLGISAGIPVFVWDDRWDGRRKLAFLSEHRITTLFGPPSDFLPLIAELEAQNTRFPDSLALIMLGSAPVHPAFLRRLRAVAGPHVRIICLYGMTENLLVSIASSEEKLTFDEDGDFVGHPVEGVGVRIAQDGELLVRSPQAYSRYFHETGRENWHPTGDLARLRSDGGIVLLGRKKDMIIRGNFNLYPALYESTVCRMEEVDAAAFVGVYDEAAADERVYLVVEPAANSPIRGDALRRHIARSLRDGAYAIDRQALPNEIRIMQLPRSGRSRKVDKKMLRQKLQRSL